MKKPEPASQPSPEAACPERRSERVVQAGDLRVVVPCDVEEDPLLRVLRVVGAC